MPIFIKLPEVAVSVPLRGSMSVNTWQIAVVKLTTGTCFRPLAGKYVCELRIKSDREILKLRFRPLAGKYVCEPLPLRSFTQRGFLSLKSRLRSLPIEQPEITEGSIHQIQAQQSVEAPDEICGFQGSCHEPRSHWAEKKLNRWTLPCDRDLIPTAFK
jgi:hypothetical protein